MVCSQITDVLIEHPAPSKGESEFFNHGRSGGPNRWSGRTELVPDPKDYERAFWSRRQVQKFSKARRGVFPGCLSFALQTEATEPQKQNLSIKERSSTELRFASFPRAMVRDPARLSRGRDERPCGRP
jgi:hypothetical protein